MNIRLILTIFMLVLCMAFAQTEPSQPTTLRLGVSLTPQELSTFSAALEQLQQAHPEWDIILEQTPQAGLTEKLNTQVAAGRLPDVVRISGNFPQRWIQLGAFVDLSPMITARQIDLGDFYSGPLELYRWQGSLWGLPDSAAPDLVYFNKQMFDSAGLAYPTDDWSFEDMRQAAIQLTQDANGRSPLDEDFDPESVVQWGWNGGVSSIYQRHLVQPFGADWCANVDCTLMDLTSPEVMSAVNWWASLVHDDHAAPYDPYGGSQTGIPGDPFMAGLAAMGLNGFFAIGQLNATEPFDYDVVQPFIGIEGKRFTPLSSFGYVIAATTEAPEEAMDLVEALLEPSFLAEAWAKPGHFAPARRSAAEAVINPTRAPQNQGAILAAMEYGGVYLPNSSSSFEAYLQTIDTFIAAMRGDIEVSEALQSIEENANAILESDRQP